jgi:hypothetical protein
MSRSQWCVHAPASAGAALAPGRSLARAGGVAFSAQAVASMRRPCATMTHAPRIVTFDVDRLSIIPP